MKTTFTAQEVAQIQRLLREAANEPEETFDTKNVVGMLSDEIEALRRQNMSDDAIAALISQGAGATVTGEEVSMFFASAEERGHGGR